MQDGVGTAIVGEHGADVDEFRQVVELDHRPLSFALDQQGLGVLFDADGEFVLVLLVAGGGEVELDQLFLARLDGPRVREQDELAFRAFVVSREVRTVVDRPVAGDLLFIQESEEHGLLLADEDLAKISEFLEVLHGDLRHSDDGGDVDAVPGSVLDIEGEGELELPEFHVLLGLEGQLEHDALTRRQLRDLERVC